MKKTFKLFGVVLAAAAVFAACVKDPEVKPSQKATELSIEPATIEAEIAPNGPFDVQVKANGTWVVVNSLDWVTVEPNKGEGDATVQVTVAANEKEGEQLAPRSGEISFVGAATCSQTLAIAQAGNEDLLVEAVPYTINFCETQGTWTIEDKTLPEALTYVWTQTANYGMKASAYVNQCYATESWLISPVFDLTKETVAILNIEHALNKGSNAKCAVMAKTTDSAEWVKLDVPTWPGTANEDGSYTGSSWDFVESGDIDLTAFCGKKAQIAFVYGSTEADAPTWEIKTVVVTNDASPKFSVPTEDINLRAFDTKATIKVSGNVDWTAVASEGATVEPAEGKGGLTVTVTIPENTDMENAKEYTVTFKTTAAVETAEYVVKIVQAKAEELPATTLAQIFEKGVGVYATGELTVMAKASGNVIVSDGTANMMYYKSGNELAPGQVIKFESAEVSERNGLLQINGSDYELLEKTVTPEYGTAVEIATDEDVQNWGGVPQYQYIHFTGVMGSDNRTIKVGEWGIYIVKTEGYAGQTVSVYGYANGKATSYKTITTTLVSIEATEIPGNITVKSAVSLEVGATVALAATVNSGAALSYASADETVATVSAEGVVTAVKEGTTTITVTAPATGIYTAATAEVAVTVKAASAGGDDPVVAAGTVLWKETFGNWGVNSTTFTNLSVLGEYDGSGTEGYEENANVSLTASSDQVRGTTASGTNCTSGHLWFNKSQDADVTTSPIRLYGATNLILSYDQGTSGSSLTPSYSVDNGATWVELAASGPGASTVNSYAITVDAETIILKFSHFSTNAKNTRFDNPSLTVAE